MAYDVDTTIQQPLSALFQQADQVREFLNLARQKVEFATAQNAFGNGVPMFDTISEDLPVIGTAEPLVAAVAAVGG
jgi:hypothetical protein